MCGFSRNSNPIVLTNTDISVYQSLRLSGLTEKQAAAYLRYTSDRLHRHTYIGVRKSIRKWENTLLCQK
ncbi:hypothetical protein VPHD51_0075 [Vibrio phage D51]